LSDVFHVQAPDGMGLRCFSSTGISGNPEDRTKLVRIVNNVHMNVTPR
jgi:hypothetical protein